MKKYLMAIAKDYSQNDEEHVRMLYMNTKHVFEALTDDKYAKGRLGSAVDMMACFLTKPHSYKQFMHLQGLVQFLNKIKYDMSDLYVNAIYESQTNDMITYDIRSVSRYCDSILCDVISDDMVSDMMVDAVC